MVKTSPEYNQVMHDWELVRASQRASKRASKNKEKNNDNNQSHIIDKVVIVCCKNSGKEKKVKKTREPTFKELMDGCVHIPGFHSPN